MIFAGSGLGSNEGKQEVDPDTDPDLDRIAIHSVDFILRFPPEEY